MNESKSSSPGDTHVLHGLAVWLPLRTEAAERSFHENMSLVADSLEEKAAMLADPETSLRSAFERQREIIARSYENALVDFVGEEYEAVARAYRTGERTDGVAAMAAYFLEATWRLQQMHTVTETTFFPLVLRYPSCVTVNVRFTSAYVSDRGVRYESPEHCVEDLAEYVDAYHDDSRVSQRRAAERITEFGSIIRSEFPDPDDVPFAERKTGGIVSAAGRRGSEFTSALESVEPDRDRFESPPDGPRLVPSGKVAQQTEEAWLPDGSPVT